MENYISYFEIQNYRSCKKTSVMLNKNLSALIGVNGSGKSNFLNSLLLLKKMTKISRHLPEEDSPKSICSIKTTFIIDGKPLSLKTEIHYRINDENIDQVFKTKQIWNFFEFTGEDKPVIITIPQFFELLGFIQPIIQDKTPNKIRENEFNEFISKSINNMYGSTIEYNVNHFNIIEKLFKKVNEMISNISYYSASQFTDPSKCQTYFEIGEENSWDPFGRKWNVHQRFMRDLYREHKNPNSKYKEFLSIVGIEGISLIESIEFQEILVPHNVVEVGIGGKVSSKEENKILVIPNFTIKSIKLSPNQLSEGTFKTLAIIFYLVTDTSQLLILEEPEVCIHHGLLDSILNIVKESSLEKQIIISTHSDFVLDSLDPENVFIVRNDQKVGTTIKHIPEDLSARDYKALKEYLKETGNLGEYWRHGGLEE
jgi:AAA15 family ATPase/GTPase